MTIRRPLVNISGDRSELPPGDTIVGGVVGTLTAGSGLQLVGGGNLANDLEVDVNIAPNPSGLIFVNNEFLALDGRAQVTGDHALASGNYALDKATTALASGVAADAIATSALASGISALEALTEVRTGTVSKFTAGGPIPSGSPVGFNDQNEVLPVSLDNDPSIYLSGELNTDFDQFTFANYGDGLGVFNESEYVFAGRYRSLNDIYAVTINYDRETDTAYSGTPVAIHSGSAFTVGTKVYDKENKKFAVFYEENDTQIAYGTLCQISGDTVISGGTYQIDSRAGTMERVISSEFSPTLSGFGTLNFSNTSPDRIWHFVPVQLSGNNGGSVYEDALVSGGAINLDIDRSNIRCVPRITTQGNNNLFFIHLNRTSGSEDRLLHYVTVSGENYTPVFVASGTSTFGNNFNPSYKFNSYSPITNKNYTFGSVVGNANIFVETTELSGTTVVYSSGTKIPNTIANSNIYLTGNHDEYNDTTNLFYAWNTTGDPLYTVQFAPSGESFTSTSGLRIYQQATNANDSPQPAMNSGSSCGLIIYGATNAANIISFEYGTKVSPLKDGALNYFGVAQDSAVSGGTVVEVRLPGSYDQAHNSSLNPGDFAYLVSGGFTSSSGVISDRYVDGWKAVGRAVDSSTIILTDTIP